MAVCQSINQSCKEQHVKVGYKTAAPRIGDFKVCGTQSRPSDVLSLLPDTGASNECTDIRNHLSILP